ARRRLHRATFGEPDEGVAGERRAAHRDAAPGPQHAEVGALLAVDEHDRLLRAQGRALPRRRPLRRGAHPRAPATTGDAFACTLRTNLGWVAGSTGRWRARWSVCQRSTLPMSRAASSSRLWPVTSTSKPPSSAAASK